MALTSNATPLIALDAVVLDTETTGLDPERARVVEMAALAVSGGRIEEARAFRSLVRPGVAIPPDATAIHGIDDSAVLSAPVFADVWPQLQGFVGDSVV